MPTIKDIARKAGVAPITASRVINHTGYVSDATRRRVEEAIDALGYIPNHVARSLRTRQTQTLALVVTNIASPFWSTVARGVEDVANQAGFSVILCNSDGVDAKEYAYVQGLIQRQVDGFLLVPARSACRAAALIQKQRIPLVALDRTVATPVDSVRADSEGGAYALTRHLVEQGHRRIAILSGPPEVSTSVERVAGYRRALAEAGVPRTQHMVVHHPFTRGAGHLMAQQVLALTPPPTAIFAANAFFVSGAFLALQEAGLRVPEDVALVSFDDLPATPMTHPFLTAAVQPVYEMGREATQLLLQRIASDERPKCQEILLPTHLVIRRSSLTHIPGGRRA